MLMARVGPEDNAAALRRPFAREMDFSGLPMKGFIYVEPPGFASEADLRAWVACASGLWRHCRQSRVAFHVNT